MLTFRSDLQTALQRWSEHVAGAPTHLALPLDRSRPETLTGPVSEHAFSFTEPFGLGDLAIAEGVGREECVLAAYVGLLHRYSDETDIVIAAWSGSGYIPLRIVVDPKADFSALVRAVRHAREAIAAKTEVLPEALGAGTVVHAAFAAAAPGGPCDVRLVPTDIALRVARETPQCLRCSVAYRHQLFNHSTIERFTGHLKVLFAAAVRAPDCSVRTLPLATQGDQRILAAWNATEAPYRKNCTTVELVQEQAARTPGAIAAEFEGCAVTYAQLDERANRLGCYLRTRGVGVESRVALYLERSIDMIVAVLGVQRAGGAFVPIDPDYPSERITFMLVDSGASVVLTQESMRERLTPGGALVVSIDGEADAISAAAATPPEIDTDPSRLAHIIYTSGSTGRPKGVQIEHRNVVNFLFGIRGAIDIGPGDTLIAIAPLVFDISGVDIFLPLMSGARVVVATRETAVNPKALMALIERQSATHLQATPTTWRMMIDSGWEGRSGLTCMSTGEALPPQLAVRLFGLVETIWNLYGPTEATYATMQRIVPGEPITIGRPMANVTTYVLDTASNQLPPGVRGELYIGGAGITRGYLNRPELTVERFLPDPFRGSSSRMYRTGDVARFRCDGAIEYLGRADFQVKLRGYRIEPGEIETRLEQRADLRSAIVTVREQPSGEAELVAYVTSDPTKRVSAAALRRDLAIQLPAYMVPDSIVILDELPLNVNGKVDRSRLPAPLRDAMGGAQRRGIAEPKTPLESELRAIWEAELGIRPIGTADDFFELGITSIVAARLFDRIERDLGTKLPLSPLFQAPTISKLAALIDSDRLDRSTTSLVPIQPHGHKTPIFCVHGGTGTILHFQPLAKHLGPSQPFYGLQMKGLYGDAAPYLSVKAMARHYLREIRGVQARGPYVLAGYCFGGMVAAEMARQLESRNERVALVVMFNGASPRYVERYGPVWKKQSGAVEQIPLIDRVRRALREARPQRWRYHVRARRRMQGMRDRLRIALGHPVPPEQRESAFLEICRVAAKRHRLRKVPAPVLLFNGEGLYHTRDLGWGQLAPDGIASIEVPGEHRIERDTMREPHAAFIAARLREALEGRFGNGSSLAQMPLGRP